MTNAKKPGENLAEGIMGFGRRELATAKDLLVEPSQVLAAWMEAYPICRSSIDRCLRTPGR